MLEHIYKTAEIWNTRLQRLLQENGFTQKTFARKYKQTYGTGSQSDVSKWMRVGFQKNKKGGIIGFPEYITMKRISDLLNVSVGYLTGETDNKTFEIDDICKSTKLTPMAVETILDITSGKSIPPFHRYPRKEINAAISNMISAPSFLNFICGICDLVKTLNAQKHPRNYFQQAYDGMRKEVRDDAFALFKDSEDAIKSGIVATNELWALKSIFEYADLADIYQAETLANDIKSSRFALNELFLKLLNETISDDNLDSMLP